MSLVRVYVSESGVGVWFRVCPEICSFQFGPLRADGIYWFFNPIDFPANLVSMIPELQATEMDIAESFITKPVECFLPVPKPLNLDTDLIIQARYPVDAKNVGDTKFVSFYVPFGIWRN
jgi:hypothetical protein